MFFCRADDELYNKEIKLQILINLAKKENVEELISELSDYASDRDIIFT